VRPGQGKTDPIDAVAIARMTAREPSLPPARLQHQLPHLTNMAHLRAALELLSGDDSFRAK
jgi:hypothetical protein